MKKVVLGFSGGVDSTAAAVILKEQGYDVTALYFDVLQNGNDAASARAEEVASLLGLNFLYRNVSREFSDVVLDRFKSDYLRGRTPIPCMFCNPRIKFRTLLDAADSIGAEAIATGHYASVVSSSGAFFAAHAANQRKDQSYMLGRLGQDVLRRLILPLGTVLDKETVRNTLQMLKLPNFADKDSQDICFLPDGDYRAYLSACGCEARPGDIVDRDGKILGHHDGIWNFTFGQRKGLGVAVGHPVFVTHIDAERNTVVLGEEEDLFRRDVHVNELFFAETGSCTELPAKYDGKEITCKLRYAAKEAACAIEKSASGAILHFEDAQRAPTPGQAAVFYENERVLGSAIIIG